MRNVLILTYYWPPSGGPAVQRVLKFCKYLPKFGWNPIILTVEGGEYPALDPSLVSEIDPAWKVVKTGTLEPFRLFKRLTGRSAVPTYTLSGSQKESMMSRFSRWVRFNLVVPDARIGWYPYAVSAGKKIINEDRIDVIFSSGPPHTVHLVAKKISEGSIPWVADFRDPWTDRFYYEESTRLGVTRKLDMILESRVLQAASQVTTVSPGVKSLLSRYTDPDKIQVVYNGYDESDFDDDFDTSEGGPIQISYIGTLTRSQSPDGLFKALERLKRSKPECDFQLNFIGNVHPEIQSKIDREFQLGDKTRYLGYVPHKEAIRWMQSSDYLLLVIPNTSKNTGIVTGKLFEYIRSGTPIILIGPQDSDAARIIQETKSGFIFDYQAWNKIEDLFLNPSSTESANADQYSRMDLTQLLGTCLNEASLDRG